MDFNEYILKKALLDSAEEEFADILDGESPDIRFSKKYILRRKRFLKSPFDYNKPKLKPWQRFAVQAAVIVLVIFSLIVSAKFTVSASASELQLVTKAYKDHLTYTYTNEDTSNTDAGDWYVSYLPEGYSVYRAEDMGDYCSTHYTNGSDFIDFMYFHTSAYLNISLKGGSYQLESCKVNGEPAIFHRSEHKGRSSILMWFSEDGDLVFMLDASLPLDEMIIIAESVVLNSNSTSAAS